VESTSVKEKSPLTQKAMRKIVKQIFKAVDLDDNGFLTLFEFGRMMREEKIQQELLTGKKYGPDDLKNVFGMIDKDDSGELSFEEVFAGLMSLIEMERKEPRMRAFLMKALSEVASDRSPSDVKFSMANAASLIGNSSTQKKLMRSGIDLKHFKNLLLDKMEVSSLDYNYDELDGALEQMFSQSGSAADAEQAVRQFKDAASPGKLHSAADFTTSLLRLRKPKVLTRWKVAVKMAFEQADTEKDGSITREDFRAAMDLNSVKDRLRCAGLDPGTVEAVFVIVDGDEADDVTEAELMFGIERMMKFSGGTGTLSNAEKMEFKEALQEEMKAHGWQGTAGSFKISD